MSLFVVLCFRFEEKSEEKAKQTSRARRNPIRFISVGVCVCVCVGLWFDSIRHAEVQNGPKFTEFSYTQHTHTHKHQLVGFAVDISRALLNQLRSSAAQQLSSSASVGQRDPTARPIVAPLIARFITFQSHRKTKKEPTRSRWRLLKRKKNEGKEKEITTKMERPARWFIRRRSFLRREEAPLKKKLAAQPQHHRRVHHR